jgi:hypothetical protein
MKNETVIMILESLMCECSRRFSDHEKRLKIRNWFIMLKDLSDEQGMYGLEKALAMPLDFMPSVGKFKDFCTTVDGAAGIEDEAKEAWAIVIKNLAYNASPVFKNSIIPECIRKMGGWKYLCSMLEKDKPFRRDEFVSMYKVYKRRGGDYKLNLIGSGQIQNYVFIGFNENDDTETILKQIKAGRRSEYKTLEMLQQKMIEAK